jgi:hypothetical protein
VRDSNRTMLSAIDVSTFTPACRSQYAWGSLPYTPVESMRRDGFGL